MFESALLAKLTGDTTLIKYVSTYFSAPAIFAEFAPESAEMPYITFRITRSADESPAVQKFSIFVDYYDYEKSAVRSRKAAERIELLLDRCELSHDRYSNIRIFFFSGSPLEEDDPRSIHYNLQFMARAGRKNFCDQLDTGLTSTTTSTTTTTAGI